MKRTIHYHGDYLDGNLGFHANDHKPEYASEDDKKCYCAYTGEIPLWLHWLAMITEYLDCEVQLAISRRCKPTHEYGYEYDNEEEY